MSPVTSHSQMFYQVTGLTRCIGRHASFFKVTFCSTMFSSCDRGCSHGGHGPDQSPITSMDIYPHVAKLQVPYLNVVTWQVISALWMCMDIYHLTGEGLRFKVSRCLCKMLHLSIWAALGVPWVSRPLLHFVKHATSAKCSPCQIT